MSADVGEFVTRQLEHQPKDVALFEAALTHSSIRGENYERLEFLGDRVLGVVMAHWLYERFPDEPEGSLSRRFNTLVARETCGEVGRALGIPAVLRLGKQALEDRANWSDNVLGDAVEALVGALYLEAGIDAAEALIHRLWEPLVDQQHGVPMHPKSALQELAAARDLPNPLYEVVSRSGTPHAPCFRIRVSLKSLGKAEADGSSKQEAETKAAEALLQKLQ